jgi:hypothetical protein
MMMDWEDQDKVTIFINSINQLVCVTQMHCIFCEVGT